ncbi:MAG: hypothetical protein WAU33_02220 [Candidatus Binataceae bacterium]
MNPNEYLRRIEEAFQGEVLGEAMFHAMAGAMEDPERRYQMRVLEQLEIETKELLRANVKRLGGDATESASARQTGIAQAATLAKMPWAKYMHIFRREVTKFVARFEELENSGPTADLQMLAALTAHERALQSFSEREFSGSGSSADPLEPVLKLLKVVPPRTTQD